MSYVEYAPKPAVFYQTQTTWSLKMVHVNGKWQQFLKSQDPTPNAEFKLVSYPNTVKASLATSTGPPNLRLLRGNC